MLRGNFKKSQNFFFFCQHWNVIGGPPHQILMNQVLKGVCALLKMWWGLVQSDSCRQMPFMKSYRQRKRSILGVFGNQDDVKHPFAHVFGIFSSLNQQGSNLFKIRWYIGRHASKSIPIIYIKADLWCFKVFIFFFPTLMLMFMFMVWAFEACRLWSSVTRAQTWRLALLISKICLFFVIRLEFVQDFLLVVNETRWDYLKEKKTEKVTFFFVCWGQP